MSKLIELFVQCHRHQASTTDKPDFEFDLQQEMLKIREAANRKMESQRLGFSQDYKITVAQLDYVLAAQLTQELAKVNLFDAEQCLLIKKSIELWQPSLWNQQHQIGLKIKEKLLALLPDAVKKQRLDQTCQEYKTHLKSEIEADLARYHPSVYDDYGRERSTVVISGQTVHRQRVKAHDLDYFLQNEAKTLPIEQPRLTQAIQKYERVSAMQLTLHTATTASRQIQHFATVLAYTKPILEKNRDSLGMRFVKWVGTLLTLGVAAACGIFSVKGAQTTEALTGILDDKAQPPRAAMA